MLVDALSLRLIYPSTPKPKVDTPLVDIGSYQETIPIQLLTQLGSVAKIRTERIIASRVIFALNPTAAFMESTQGQYLSSKVYHRILWNRGLRE
jgi:hypothetical protein